MIETIVALLDMYRVPAVFTGAFFFGDSVILTAAYLTGERLWNPAAIFLAAFFGTAVADSLWFLGGAVISRYLLRSRFLRDEEGKAARLLQKLENINPLRALIIVKFLYGTRIAMILYTAARQMPFGLFSLYNSIGILAWLAVFFPLGYLAGRGVGIVLPQLGTIQMAIAVFIMSAIGMRMLTLWLTRKVTNE